MSHGQTVCWYWQSLNQSLTVLYLLELSIDDLVYSWQLCLNQLKEESTYDKLLIISFYFLGKQNIPNIPHYFKHAASKPQEVDNLMAFSARHKLEYEMLSTIFSILIYTT